MANAACLTQSMQRIYLKKGREAPILRGHPWIFSGAIEKVEGDHEDIGLADIFDAQRHWIARGFFNTKSQIRVRVLTWRNEPIDRNFFLRRLSRALAIRETYLPATTDAYRLINGEGDLLPGLIVDRYKDFLVCQIFTAGMEMFKEDIVGALTDVIDPKGVFERSEGKVREEEGLEPLVGALAGDAPPDTIAVIENGKRFLVDVKRGQKTGFFLDQRDNRAFLLPFARDQRMLNCFSYSGAFSVYGFAGGAKSIVTLDSSRAALQLAEKNLAVNGFKSAEGELLKGDAFTYLKESGSSFDLIVLDPPSLAHRRNDVSAATGGYKFLNLHALRRLNPGGILLTFSCSQHLTEDLFQKVVFGAAVDAGRKVTILKRLGHSIDHPVSLHHPEGDYLKGLALRVLD
jgi:23S rRNA (cytosine1962-C5)-methyltransferase